MVRNANLPQPVTVAEVAASIGAGLAKAALAGKVDGKLVDTSFRIERDAHAGHRHRQGCRRRRDHPPFDRAPAGLRGQGTVPRGAGDHRPGDRKRLLLRLRLQAPVHAGRSGGHREAHGRAGEEGFSGDARGLAARQGGGVLQVDRRALQGGTDRGDSRRPGCVAVSRGRFHRPLPRPARAVDRQAQGLQADEGGRRLLARRFEERAVAAHLRHGLGEEGRAGRLSAHAGRGREARPPQAGPAARSVPPAGGSARPGVLASARLGGVAGDRAVHAPRLSRQRLPGSALPADPRPQPVGEVRPLGALQGTTCSPPSRRTATTRSSR